MYRVPTPVRTNNSTTSISDYCECHNITIKFPYTRNCIRNLYNGGTCSRSRFALRSLTYSDAIVVLAIPEEDIARGPPYVAVRTPTSPSIQFQCCRTHIWSMSSFNFQMGQQKGLSSGCWCLVMRCKRNDGSRLGPTPFENSLRSRCGEGDLGRWECIEARVLLSRHGM
jgi:hypothetical protein